MLVCEPTTTTTTTTTTTNLRIAPDAREGPTERRRGLRIRQSRPVKVFESVSGRFFGGQTADVSATGLRIELPIGTPVRAGCTVHVHVGLSAGGQPLANRREMMPARVIWVDRNRALSGRGGGRLQAGVELLAAIAAHADAA